MIRMRYGQLNKLMGHQGLLVKIFNTPMRAQLSYRFKKMFDELGIMGKEISKEFKEYVKPLNQELCQKDEKGELVKSKITTKNEKGEDVETIQEDSFEIIPGQEKEYQKRMAAFWDKEFTIERDALSFEEYSNTDLKFSVSEIDLLEPLFTETQEQKGGPDNVKKLHA